MMLQLIVLFSADSLFKQYAVNHSIFFFSLALVNMLIVDAAYVAAATEDDDDDDVASYSYENKNVKRKTASIRLLLY
jgi:hypothetical protein